MSEPAEQNSTGPLRSPPATGPVRVQLRRTKGWKMPENTVRVARPGPWGNPFRVGGYFMVGDPNKNARFGMSWCETFVRPPEPQFTLIETAAQAVEFYKRLMARGYYSAAELENLRGKNLACFCALDQPCHADVLLALANVTEGDRNLTA